MTSPRNTEERVIADHIGKIIDGIQRRDIDLLRRVYADDVVSFDVEPPLQHLGIEAKLKNWSTVFTVFRDVTYELRNLNITVGGDVAFGHGFGRLSGTLTDGTQTPGMWVRATFCFRKIDGEWLIVHDQASVPFDLPSGKGVTDLEPS
jgi:ketosteroid isomerase-like protein